MDDRSLYATILGLDAPWEVERVELRARAVAEANHSSADATIARAGNANHGRKRHVLTV
jgi:hypothetical protein